MDFAPLNCMVPINEESLTKFYIPCALKPGKQINACTEKKNEELSPI